MNPSKVIISQVTGIMCSWLKLFYQYVVQFTFATQIVLLGNSLNLLDVSARVTIRKVILRKRSKRQVQEERKIVSKMSFSSAKSMSVTHLHLAAKLVALEGCKVNKYQVEFPLSKFLRIKDQNYQLVSFSQFICFIHQYG